MCVYGCLNTNMIPLQALQVLASAPKDRGAAETALEAAAELLRDADKEVRAARPPPHKPMHPLLLVFSDSGLWVVWGIRV